MSADLFNYHRRTTYNVHVGRTPLGSNNPIRLQSMNTTSTDDVEASVQQAARIARAGADYVRLTTQGTREVESLGRIHSALRAMRIKTPLVADVHFNPAVADAAAKTVEAVRVNPGNYVDPARVFKHIDYTDEEYNAELQRLEQRFVQLLDICRQHCTALRIGVNHGSLSDRIMSRYGDTPAGIVESCMEFLRICVKHDFLDVVVSIKASNPVIMVQSVRLLVKTMDEEGMKFPLHLGVTEAGEGEDGRIKSALGIGALLNDGMGDTIRVSLSEDPEREIPVARKLVRYILYRRGKKRINALAAPSFNYICPKRRETRALECIGGDNVPVVIGVNTAPSDYDADSRPDFVYIGGYDTTKSYDPTMNYIVDAANYSGQTNTFPLYTTENLHFLPKTDAAVKFIETAPFFFNDTTADCLRENPDAVLVIHSDSRNSLGEARFIIHSLTRQGIKNPVIFAKGYSIEDGNTEDFGIAAAADTGNLLFDRLIDGICIYGKPEGHKAEISQTDALHTSFSILQAARQRITKTEYISCPGCGRTLYNLPQTIARVKAATAGMKGLKIAIMGCIVNGPGEMADADYGYVGAGRGKISLYRRKECVLRNIPEDEAVEHLLELINADREQNA
jgi:(E)-4-hydroxy-3-methylbut-2-enyl-diphosphate synthase